jgi:succinyl-CoA synthetase alpha subunit
MNWQKESKVLVQGIEQPLAQKYARKMQKYGTNIVAGISVGQGGEVLDGIPLFNLVEEAIATIGKIEVSLIFVEHYAAVDAALEAIAAGIKNIIIFCNAIPPLDLVRLLQKAEATDTLILGPDSDGIIIPDTILLGRLETQFFSPGKVGIISVSDRLIYEVALQLNKSGLGESIGVTIGQEGILGSTVEKWLKILEGDPSTEAIVILSLPGIFDDSVTAEFITKNIKKPVVFYLPGIDAPAARSLKDAATIIATQLSFSFAKTRSIREQISTFTEAKITVARSPMEIPELLKKMLESQKIPR